MSKKNRNRIKRAAKGAEILASRGQTSEFYKKRTFDVVKKTKSGESYIDKGNYNKVLKMVKKKFENDPGTFQDYIDFSQAAIEQSVADNTKLSSGAMLGLIEEKKVRKAFYNAGTSLEEAALQMGVDELELLDPNNWKNGTFTSSDGRHWAFEFSYSDTVMVILSNEEYQKRISKKDRK